MIRATTKGKEVDPESISPARLIPPVISKNDDTNTRAKEEIEGMISFKDSKTI